MKETGSYLLDVLFMGGLITASLCDFKKRKIPDAITGFLFLTGFAALFLDAAAFYKNASCRGVYCWVAAFCGSCMQAGSSRRRGCQADGGRWFLFGIVCCLGQSCVWNGACRGILSVPDVTSKWERAEDCTWTISEYGAYVWNVPLYGSMIRNRRPDL